MEENLLEAAEDVRQRWKFSPNVQPELKPNG